MNIDFDLALSIAAGVLMAMVARSALLYLVLFFIRLFTTDEQFESLGGRTIRGSSNSERPDKPMPHSEFKP